MTTRQVMMNVMMRLQIEEGKKLIIEQLKREHALVVVLSQSTNHIN